MNKTIYISNTKYTKNVMLYYLAITIYFIVANINILSIVEIDNGFKNIIYSFVIMLFIIKIISDKFTIKEYIFLAVIGIICIYTSLKIGDMAFIMNFFIIAAVKKVNIDKVVKFDSIIKILTLLFTTILYFSLKQKIQIELVDNRHYMFFENPNTTLGLVFWIIIDWIFINRNNLNKTIKIATIGFIPMIFYYTYTLSRTSMYIYVLLYITLIIVKIFNKKVYIHKVIKTISKYAIDIIFILSLIICITYTKSDISTTLNKMLSGRLYNSYITYEKYGVTLFANEETTNITRPLDNFYVRSAVSYGCVVYVIVSIMIKNFNKKNTNTILNIIVLFFCVYLFCELFPFTIARTVALLIIGKNVLVKEEKDKNGNSNNNSLQL